MTIWANVGCGPYRAPAPWLNLDCHEGDNVHPDLLVEAERPLAAWEEGMVDRVYLGHVLEHIPWPEVPAFLQGIERAMAHGGEVCIVGPDVLRIIRRWHEGLDPEGWPLVESCLENPWGRCYEEEGYGVTEGIEPENQWKYARHWWNCYEGRVVYALEKFTGLADVEPQPITEAALGAWPLTAYTAWQCAVTARRP